MLQVRRSAERGHFNHGWLETWHTFSFADYRDSRHMGFRSLRVINEDRVQPGAGFGRHPHRDMEILTYILSGNLRHEDSLGNGAVLVPGDVQYMSAGDGVLHSEVNPSASDPVHLVQIWIRPNAKGLPPRYEQRSFPAASGKGLTLLASGDGADGSITIRQDARLIAVALPGGGAADYAVAAGRGVWLQLLRGELRVRAGDEEATLKAGDGAAIEATAVIGLESRAGAEALLFDLADG